LKRFKAGIRLLPSNFLHGLFYKECSGDDENGTHEQTDTRRRDPHDTLDSNCVDRPADTKYNPYHFSPKKQRSGQG
jgi:hypothetical protein